MMHRLFTFLFAVSAVFGIAGQAVSAQSGLERFRVNNSKMATLQPPLITPLLTPDPRLVQYARFSVSHQYTPTGTETVNYGNCKGGGIIVGKRFEFDWNPPNYVVHNSKVKDGAGDTTLLAKYRISSGNAEKGNYEVSAVLSRTFATGSYSNGAATGSYTPAVTAAWAHRKFDFISSIGETLPTGKIAQQGRTIAWNGVVQLHATRSLWFEVEDNATYFKGGPRDGKMQNFMLPAAFYVIRPKSWKPTHPFFIVDAGMQIATSQFHTYNHSLITEARILF